MPNQTIKCSVCKIGKSSTDFPSLGSEGRRPECKECFRKKMSEWRKTPQGFLSSVYTSLQRNRVRDLDPRPIFYDRMLAQEDFRKAFDIWEARDFRPSEKPRLILDNPSMGYDIINLRWVNKKDHNVKVY